MRPLDLADPNLGYSDDLEMAAPSGRLNSLRDSAWSLGVAHLDPTPFEVSALIEALSEADDEELAGLEAEGRDAAGGWSGATDDQQLADAMAEAAVYGDREPDFIRSMADLDRIMAGQSQREHTRQAENRAQRENRTPTDEVRLSNAMARYDRGTYLPGQMTTADLAGTMFDDLTAAAATSAEVISELKYQLFGEGQPLARTHRQALPHMSARRLTQLGLKS